MNGHTPGPWFVSRDPRDGMEWNLHIAEVARPHMEICSMFHTKDDDDNATGEANARLIAAAPDLLVALKALRDNINEFGKVTDGEFIDAADAAIAKATDGLLAARPLWPCTFRERNVAEGVDQIEPADIASYAYPEGERERYTLSGWGKALRRGFAIIRLDRISVDPALEFHDIGCVKRYGAVYDGDSPCECEKRIRQP